MTHICVSKLTIIGSDNCLAPGRRQAIIWTNTGIFFIRPLGTNFSEMLIEIDIVSFKKMHLKTSIGKWQPFCLGLKMLILLDYHQGPRLLTQISRTSRDNHKKLLHLLQSQDMHERNWWRHQTFSALLAVCEGNSPVTGEFPTQRAVTRSFDGFVLSAWMNGWVNNREAGDLRRHHAHYGVTIMETYPLNSNSATLGHW